MAGVTKKDRTEERRQANNRSEPGLGKLSRERTRKMWLVLTCPVVPIQCPSSLHQVLKDGE